MKIAWVIGAFLDLDPDLESTAAQRATFRCRQGCLSKGCLKATEHLFSDPRMQLLPGGGTRRASRVEEKGEGIGGDSKDKQEL